MCEIDKWYWYTLCVRFQLLGHCLLSFNVLKIVVACSQWQLKVRQPMGGGQGYCVKHYSEPTHSITVAFPFYWSISHDRLGFNTCDLLYIYLYIT